MIVFICGFMGAGKSTLLEELTHDLKKENRSSQVYCLDLDEEILNNLIKPEYSSICEFIKLSGIEKFREFEFVTIKNLVQKYGKKKIILSLGGGALENIKSHNIIRSSGKLLWLNTDYKICFERIKNDKTRPLASNSLDEMKKLYELRRLSYEDSDERGDVEKLKRLIKEWIYEEK